MSFWTARHSRHSGRARVAFANAGARGGVHVAPLSTHGTVLAAIGGSMSKARMEPARPAPQPLQPESPQPTEGIILVLGEPRDPLPASSYQVEVSLPDGGKSFLKRTVERNADGEATALRIVFQTVAPENEARKQGG
jgi:hypothetical protein